MIWIFLFLLLPTSLYAVDNYEIKDVDVQRKFGTPGLAPVDIKRPTVVISSFTAHSYSGFALGIASGTIGASGTITISTNGMNVQALGVPVCGEFENVNTAAVSVRVKSMAGLPNFFTVFNADGANIKNFSCIFPVKL